METLLILAGIVAFLAVGSFIANRFGKFTHGCDEDLEHMTAKEGRLTASVRRKIKDSKERQEAPQFTVEEWNLIQRNRKLNYDMRYGIHITRRKNAG